MLHLGFCSVREGGGGGKSVQHSLINPRRACAARVTVVGSVCPSVCLSVCPLLSICLHE